VRRQIEQLWQQVTSDTTDTCAVKTQAFNLVAYASNETLLRRLVTSLTEVSKRQPSRTVIVLADRLRPESAIDAEVSIDCSDLAAAGLCQENVKIIAHGRAADHVESVVAPLLLKQLPTYLWWPGQLPLGHRAFHALLSVANQLIIDSADFASPGDGYASVGRLAAATQGVNDLNWARLAPWRETIALFFDGPGVRDYVNGIQSMEIVFGRGEADFVSATASTLLLLGWMACRLGWETETSLEGLATKDVTLSVLAGERLIPIQLKLADRGAAAAGRLVHVSIEAELGSRPPASFSIDRSDDLEYVTITTAVEGEQDVCSALPLHRKTDEEHLADELSLAGHDTLYEQVVQFAARMGGRETWQPI